MLWSAIQAGYFFTTDILQPVSLWSILNERHHRSSLEWSQISSKFYF